VAARQVVRKVDREVGAELRREVLRPWMTPDEFARAQTSPPGTIYAAVTLNGQVLAVGSVMPNQHPHDPHPGDWRIRGMATRGDQRGKGYGSQVLVFCEQQAREHGARRLWCNARVGARTLYERAGMQVEGDEFELEPIGPHYLMSKALND
jgi:GNAT superfamily N-acetyltransferase